MIRQTARGLWRLGRACIGIRTSSFIGLPLALGTFIRDWRQFRALGGNAPFSLLAPTFFDSKPKSQSGGGHYFYQDVWALRRLSQFKPPEHHDIGSRLDGFVAQATAICPIFYWDIRAPNFDIPDFTFRRANILGLPLEDQSIQSLSCLHVAEHIGLGRYGDAIDPEGAEKALRELERVLAPGGRLVFSMPIGEDRVEFNAQRIWNPLKPLKLLQLLQLQEFSVVTDDDRFIEHANPEDFVDQKFACGLYLFLR
jgi:SAM-dependent methyltransferase